MDAEQIQKLEGNPGDVFVIESPRTLSAEARRRICECWDAAVNGTNLRGCKAIVIDDGIRIRRVDQDRETEVELIVRGAKSFRDALNAAQTELAKYQGLQRFSDVGGLIHLDSDYIISGELLARMTEAMRPAIPAEPENKG